MATDRIAQAQVLAAARAVGSPVCARTLRRWSQLGILPSAIRVWGPGGRREQRCLYDRRLVLQGLTLLAANRGTLKIEEIGAMVRGLDQPVAIDERLRVFTREEQILRNHGLA